MKRNTTIKILINMFFLVLVAMIIYPMFWLVLNSLKTNAELYDNSLAMPIKYLWGNYKRAWDVGLSTYFFNSILVSSITIAATVFLGAACAYGLVRSKSKYKDIIFFMILGGLLLSPQVALISLYKLLDAFNMYNTRWALIVPYIAFRLPFAVFLMRSYFLSFPVELEEAAYIDGYSTFQTFMKIVLPISRPILSSTAIMTAIFVWNEFLFALVFLEDKAKMTIPIGLSNFKDALSTDWTVMLAGIVISSIPMLILYLLMQKNFIKALAAGSVKG